MIAALGFIIGMVLGSFTLVLADRSLKGKPFSGRSYCTHCKRNLRWYDLLPVVSYLILRGRCRFCHKKISIEYVLVEVVMGFLIALLFYQIFVIASPLIIFDLAFKTFFITILVAVTITDFRKTLIPDRIIVPSIFIALVSLLGLTVYKIIYYFYYLSQSELGRLLVPPKSDFFTRHALIYAQDLVGSIIAALIISGFFLALIIVTKGKGMGGGDVKLGFFMGLGLGFPNALLATMLAFLTGAVAALLLIISGKKHFGQHIAFGPFLVLGSLITLFYGTEIMNWYLSFSR